MAKRQVRLGASVVCCRYRRRWLCPVIQWGVQLGLSCSLLVHAADHSVTASGYLTVIGLDGYHKEVPPWCSSNEFQVVVDPDGHWSIDVKSLTGSYYETYLTYDGTNIYDVCYSDSIVGLKYGRPAVVKTESFTNHFNRAIICGGGFPYDCMDMQARAQILWLAFGAGDYLHQEPTNSMPLPWARPRWNLLAYGFRIEYELGALTPYPIRTLTFTRSTTLDLPSEKAELGRPELNEGDKSMYRAQEKQLQERKALWPDGFIAGNFEVFNYTNYDGLEVPLRFSLKVFSPELMSNDKLSQTFQGVVTNVVALTVGSFSPPILSRLRVDDERPRFSSRKKKIDSVTYTLSPGKEWPAKDSQSVMRLFHAFFVAPWTDRTYYASQRTKRIIVMAAFIGLSVLFPIVMYRMSRTRSRKPRLPSN